MKLPRRLSNAVDDAKGNIATSLMLSVVALTVAALALIVSVFR